MADATGPTEVPADRARGARVLPAPRRHPVDSPGALRHPVDSPGALRHPAGALDTRRRPEEAPDTRRTKAAAPTPVTLVLLHDPAG
ncbi:hypothetical protein ABT298_35880, partial [Streptomyces sp. NPDC001034]|uniref:hypothetical protein n=1 Tax=Streptomyces sp. NPDC001034 TaxID=3154375 RepID=UPI003324281F